MELIVNKVTKTDRKDKQEYLFNANNSKYIYGLEFDPSKLSLDYDARVISFMIADSYHVSIFLNDTERKGLLMDSTRGTSV